MASRPKRVKLAIILLLLVRMTKIKLDNEEDDTVYERLSNQMADLRPQMAVNENTWTQAMTDVWEKTEELEALFDSNGDPISEVEITKVHEDLIDLIDLL